MEKSPRGGPHIGRRARTAGVVDQEPAPSAWIRSVLQESCNNLLHSTPHVQGLDSLGFEHHRGTHSSYVRVCHNVTPMISMILVILVMSMTTCHHSDRLTTVSNNGLHGRYRIREG